MEANLLINKQRFVTYRMHFNAPGMHVSTNQDWRVWPGTDCRISYAWILFIATWTRLTSIVLDRDDLVEPLCTLRENASSSHVGSSLFRFA